MFDKEKCELVYELIKFLKPFKELKELNDNYNNSLRVITLVKTKIKRYFQRRQMIVMMLRVPNE